MADLHQLSAHELQLGRRGQGCDRGRRGPIAPTILKGWPPQAQPFHYVVYDAAGASIAIEPIGGKLKIYDNPLGVMTNSPTFDWHMTNLRNYIALNPRNVPPLKIDGMTFRQFGEGSGMLGLPGDTTPPSRFVRAACSA